MKRPLLTGITTALLAASVTTVSAIEFGIFGDVVYYQNDAPGENSAFALGALDFYASANINDNTRVFVEYVFEGQGDGVITDLERLWITRTFNDEFSVGLGRFHTPLGYWNRTYHHGAILQDTVSRPFFLEFEDGLSAILPTHIVGALSTGTFTFSAGEIAYEAYVANGPSLDTSQTKPEIDINVSADVNGDKTLGFRISYIPDAIPLKLGVMYMDNIIAESAEGNTGGQEISFGETLVEQTITGVDFKADTEWFDALFEYYKLSNDAKVGNIGKHSGDAYYIQLGYKINETNKLVYRYADLSVDINDDYFNILKVGNENHQLVAYRYDIDDSNTLKFEYNQSSQDNRADNTTMTLQWAFLVP